jgi:hypothetical protein
MTSLSPAFPTRRESLTNQIGTAVNCIFRGGGDDWGVFISGNAKANHGVTVDLNVPSGSHAGCDARAMVRALQAVRRWSKFSDLERALGMVD